MQIDQYYPELILLAKLIIASLLGGLIGYERELAEKPAGLRTHMLIAGSSVMLVGVGSELALTFPADSQVLRTDPIRIIEAIIVGISFLGAGTIFQRKDKSAVIGLTTGASILFTAAIGIAVALESYFLAVGATLFVVVTNYVLGRLERRLVGNAAKKNEVD